MTSSSKRSASQACLLKGGILWLAAIGLLNTACQPAVQPTRAIDPGFDSGNQIRTSIVTLDRTIRVRGDHAYPPFEYIDEHGQAAGFNFDIIRRIAAIMALDLDISLGPWDEVREELEQGRVDMLAGMYKTPERDALVDFTIPHFISAYSIIGPKNTSFSGLEELAGKRLAVQTGDLAHDYLLNRDHGLELVEFRDWEDIFKAIQDGQVDYAISSMVQAVGYLQQQGIRDLGPIGPPIFQERYSMAVRKGDAELLAALNEGLSILKASEEYDHIYQRWFGGYERAYLRAVNLSRSLWLSLLGLFLLASLASLWSISLRFQIKAKTAELSKELSNSEAVRTRLAEALAEARELRQAAEAANSSKSVFLAHISHELRTPLHGIIAMAELLGKSTLDRDQKQLIHNQIQAAGQLERLITDLLDLTRAAAGRLSLSPELFSLEELVSWPMESLQHSAAQKGLDLSLLLPQPQTRINSDRNRLTQILVNLVGNAIKYTQTGYVRAELRLDGEELLLQVDDSGPGISEAEQARIYDLFYQSDSVAQRHRQQGLGIGLAIVRTLVDLMDGQIAVSSQPGRGSSFSVRLPVRLVPEEAAEPAAGLELDAVAGATDARQGRPVRHRILIAEDEALNVLYLKRLLAARNIEVVGVGDGQSAVEARQREDFDLILMDIGLPVLDGLEASRRIRLWEAEQGRPAVPIAALTAHAYSQDRQDCRDAGMNGFLVKPFTETGLWQELDRLLAPASGSGV